MEPTANAGMSVSDWSSLVAMVVAICALFSPALTAFFNNQHLHQIIQAIMDGTYDDDESLKLEIFRAISE